MSTTPRSSARGKVLWIAVLALAFAYIVAVDLTRIRRVEHVTQTALDGDPIVDATSPTGYADAKRWLIVPEHHNPTYQWIAETQAMLASHRWTLHWTDTENAPIGREVRTASLYRWWIVALARVDHWLTGRPIGLSVEKSALWSDALLRLGFLLVCATCIGRRWGLRSAALGVIGLVTIYPFSASFFPGALNDFNLALLCALTSVGCIAFGCEASAKNARWFLASGIAAGIGLWVDVTDLLVVMAGLTLGVAVATFVTKQSERPSQALLPWRLWGLGGAVASLVGYLIDLHPSQPLISLETIHPLYALALIGLGECFELLQRSRQAGRFLPSTRERVRFILAFLAIAALPIVAGIIGSLPPRDLLASQLTNEPDGVIAKNVFVWLGLSDASKLTLLATAFPALLLLLIGVWAWRDRQRTTDPTIRILAATTIACAAFALTHLRSWSLVAGLVVLLSVAAARHHRWVFWSALAASFLGVLQVVASLAALRPDYFTRAEIEQFYERSIAHWLADRAGSSSLTALAPPYRTPSFIFYGGVKGLGTQNWENRAGLSATLRIVCATRSDEAVALLNQRGVTHLVLPSWDQDLQNIARLTLTEEKEAFIYQLTHSTIFEWIRPLPFRLPRLSDESEATVNIFEMVEPVNRSIAISRMTEYYLEMELPDVAQLGRQALQEFPSDVSALTTIAQVEKAQGAEEQFKKTVDAIASSLALGADRFLPWDRRVNLAVVLMLGQHRDLAQAQVERCWRDLNATRIRSLTTRELYQLMVLAKTFGLKLPTNELETLSRKLLPPELRERL